MLSRASTQSLLPLGGGFVLVLVAIAAAALLSVEQQQADLQTRHTIEIENQLNLVQILATDAETGQRGYLLTGKLEYLQPYNSAAQELGPMLDQLSTDAQDNLNRQKMIDRLRSDVSQKLAELHQTIDLRAAGRSEDAIAIVNSDKGKNLMSDLRQTLANVMAEEKQTFEARSVGAAWLDRVAQFILIGCVVLVLVLAALALADARRRQLSLLEVNRRLQLEATERRAAESQVRQLQKMEALGQLAGGMAHDFNNMLAIIFGSLEAALRRIQGTEQPPIKQYIDNAMEGANRAAILTKRILAFSRQQPLEPAILDVNKLVGGMSELLRRTIGETVAIETVLAGGLWKVHADPTQLESALVNLAVNARDAMPGGGKMTIETANSDLDERYAAANSDVTAGQYVLISVTDIGVGMPPEVAERAFDPFFTTKRAGKGTGLGLSQVFGFVKQSAGHVKIYSEVGAGTTVKIYLPRYFGEASEAEAARKLPPVALSKNKVILVVEDEDGVRETTVGSLRDLGYTVIHTGSPIEALQRLDGNPSIALLFTDVVMPEMNGRELANAALARQPDLKVLYTTGYTRNAVVHHGVLDPGTLLIVKPFTLNQLAAKIEQALRS